ncbi:uncharacterized protein LOC9300169 isoform X2 [Arabidopsis lyrata subsp. lyrata]|uniref:uncharacterized protein LOC9300169 isoform X2 n=1 Tax=Arabidopsis lyrata subsp. lyrata TaxID=81972 RepID=UPI000A29C619|nr:uncharacterized protein LOC9300169 isoform X2 [Arabidopsis lyrata subsp. lyrata]|eukprot:XP_020878678.1 uncharacterized protein LOC9300169 isoform X2 [Arabidopsis lyrata subsp. lyrata]
MRRYTVCTVFHIRPSHEIRNIDMNVVNWNQWSSRPREISRWLSFERSSCEEYPPDSELVLSRYTVRTGYWLATHDPFDDEPPIDAPAGSVVLKNRIWKLPILPKIKHFLWRAVTRSLATADRLISRGLQINRICQRCKISEENISHTLFQCSFSLMVWRLVNIPSITINSFSNDCEENLNSLLDFYDSQGSSRHQKLLPWWSLWHIWKSRNNFIFNQIRENPSKSALQAKTDIREWIETTGLNATPLHGRDTIIDTNWTRPPTHVIKCNYDAGFNSVSGHVTGGWIIRDSNGFSKCWGAATLHQARSPLEAEGHALLFALQQTWLRGFTAVMFEGDCEVLINIINGVSNDIAIDGLHRDILFWKAKFRDVSFVHTNRLCNKVAHSLAKKGCLNRTFYSDCVNPPIWLTELMYFDRIQSI